MSGAHPIRIAVTPGDPNGVGPEVVLQALHRWRGPKGVRWVLVGPRAVWERAAAVAGTPLPSGRGVVAVHDLPDVKLNKPAPGRIRVDAARVSLASLAAAVDGCLVGEFDGVVTAPICKEGWEKAGVTVPGHTEWLADRAGVDEVGMMLLGRGLRVTLATRHIALKEVPQALTGDALQTIFSLTAKAMPWLGCSDARIAVCGLNPHCGDGGMMGDEETRIIGPAIRQARRRKIPVHGPVPADTVFYQAVAGTWDAVIAMYHDQGLGPLKLWAFDAGVNLTLGLPFVRTSPDHGTAFDLAGSGKANPGSMRAALQLAAELAGRKNPWGRS